MKGGGVEARGRGQVPLKAAAGHRDRGAAGTAGGDLQAQVLGAGAFSPHRDFYFLSSLFIFFKNK